MISSFLSKCTFYLYSYCSLLLNVKDCLHVFSYYNYVKHFQYQVKYLYQSSESGSRAELECLLCKNFTDSSQNENHLLNISMNSILEKYFQLTHCQSLYNTKHPFLIYTVSQKNRTPVTFSNNSNNPGSVSTNFGTKNRQLIGT